MPGIGNKDLASRSEAVDLAFTSLWSSSLNLECGTLFLNQNLPNDPFFNKLVSLTCLDDAMLENSLKLFKKHDTVPYIYTLDQPEFDKKLLEKHFKLYDTQHVLTRIPISTVKSRARKISKGESMIWSKTFCSAYDCNEWIATVDKIVQNSCNSIDYYIDELASSCVALYESNSMLGLYCLGTVPEMRKKGLAASLIDLALGEVKKRNLGFLMLETYRKDRLLDFYFKLGFEDIYHKNVYTT
ncbi:MAG: GNAT family N-acetyltransferase [Thaumarchaeota archaeon]|nr:GNAT family N-acetyltransferase [Nitrososphaerota archaeon]